MFEEVLLLADICKGKVKLPSITLVTNLGGKEGIFFPNGAHHLLSKLEILTKHTKNQLT
jgi:hypothetical protein